MAERTREIPMDAGAVFDVSLRITPKGLEALERLLLARRSTMAVPTTDDVEFEAILESVQYILNGNDLDYLQISRGDRLELIAQLREVLSMAETEDERDEARALLRQVEKNRNTAVLLSPEGTGLVGSTTQPEASNLMRAIGLGDEKQDDTE